MDKNNCFVVEWWITHDWTEEGRYYFDNADEAEAFYSEKTLDDPDDWYIFEIKDGERVPFEF